METLGACLVGNDLPFTGQAKDIFERRVKGESWAKIAQDFNLGSPNAARKLFKQLTGIGDFKVKGSDLIKLAKGDLTPDIGKIPKLTKPKPANKPNGQVSKANVPKPKKTSDVHIDADLIDDVYVDPPGVPNVKIHGVIQDFDHGSTYAQLAAKHNLSFEDIDKIIHKHNLKKNNGDPWKAWKEKTNSKSAVEDVKGMVHHVRAQGWTTNEIEDLLGVPKKIQQEIFDGKWDPTVIPHQFPKTPSPKYSTPSQPPSQYSTMGPKVTKTKPGDNIETRGESIDFDEDNFPVARPEDFDTHNAGLSDRSESAVRAYTGSNYISINGGLRGKNPKTPQLRSLIDNMDQAMRPVRKNVTLTRGMDRHGFQMGYIDNDAILDLVGKVVSDPGYFSTSARSNAAFGGEISLRIEVPKGARGVWADPLSSHDEYEFLLARGSNIMITGVSKKTNVNGVVSFIVKGRVVV